MSRITESLYRIAGVDLNETIQNLLEDNEYKETEVRGSLPVGIELKDGVVFELSYFKKLLVKNGDKAYKKYHIPFNSEEDAISYANSNDISLDCIEIAPNGDVSIDYTDVFTIQLIGYKVNCTLNQYEGNKNNRRKTFLMNIHNIFYDIYSKSKKSDLLKTIKEKYKDFDWPRNVGVDPNSIKYTSYVFKIIKD